MTQLRDLAEPFPDRLIKRNPSGGGEYVKHSLVNERLLAIVGPFSWEHVEILRGDAPGKAPNPRGSSERARRGTPDLHNVVVGCVWRLTVEIDGRTVHIEEAGDCEEPHNWPHDGARLKDATSDAFKRCAMRPGLGLHLWSQEHYSLYKSLGDSATPETAGSGGAQVPSAPPPEPATHSPAVQEFIDAHRALNLSPAERGQFRALMAGASIPKDPARMTDVQAEQGLALLKLTFTGDR